MFAKPSPHPARSKLENLPHESLHVLAFDLAKMINDLRVDIDFQEYQGFNELPPELVRPHAIVVGSFVTNPSDARDLDLQVSATGYRHLQQILLEKQGVSFRGLHGDRCMTAVKCTVADANGVIDPASGNAHVAVWITMDTGEKVNVSVPHTVTAQTKRYDLSTIKLNPSLSFEDSARRRTFVHETPGFDPLSGEVIDPFGGVALWNEKVLKITSPDLFAADPINPYRAFVTMSRLGMTLDLDSAVVLQRLSRTPLPTDPTAIDPNRLRYEQAALFAQPQPSLGIRAAFELGFFSRDFPALAETLTGQKVETLATLADEAAKLANKLPAPISHADRVVCVLGQIVRWHAASFGGDLDDSSRAAELAQKFVFEADEIGSGRNLFDQIMSSARNWGDRT